jgi:hypothetical protein
MVDLTYGHLISGSELDGRRRLDEWAKSVPRDRAAQDEDGRYWARTSDPQLVDLGARRSTTPQRGNLGHDLGQIATILRAPFCANPGTEDVAHTVTRHRDCDAEEAPMAVCRRGIASPAVASSGGFLASIRDTATTEAHRGLRAPSKVAVRPNTEHVVVTARCEQPSHVELCRTMGGFLRRLRSLRPFDRDCERHFAHRSNTRGHATALHPGAR